MLGRVIRVTLRAPWHCYNNGHQGGGDILSESVMKHVSYVYLEYAQYIIPPVDRPEPCQGGLVWGCETSGPGLSWQRENDAWSGLSGPGGSLGKNFPGKVSHPLSRPGEPRSRNTNMPSPVSQSRLIIASPVSQSRMIFPVSQSRLIIHPITCDNVLRCRVLRWSLHAADWKVVTLVNSLILITKHS